LFLFLEWVIIDFNYSEKDSFCQPDEFFGVLRMKGYDQTSMGGEVEMFLTTHWSLIEDVQSDKDRDKALIGLLLDRYWKPVYCYLRRKGYDNEQAKDLTQGFFHEVVLNRNLVQRVDKSKGRFRMFLLHGLDQYIINEKRNQTTRKRLPKGKLVSFDIISPPDLPEAVSKFGPEDSYNYAWTAAMLDKILSEVETRCIEDDMEIHWRIFQDRIVQPILTDAKPPSFADTCEKYGIEDQKKASNMITTVKRRLQKALKDYLRTIAASENEIYEEFFEILQFFKKSAQDI
jgi:DNA-directed RNA polymerase specialized sigma24 family protein